jgi:hypothetical protein
MFSAVPAGLDAKFNAFPALKRRAIFRLSLRDKVVCANFILVSKSTYVVPRRKITAT